MRIPALRSSTPWSDLKLLARGPDGHGRFVQSAETRIAKSHGQGGSRLEAAGTDVPSADGSLLGARSSWHDDCLHSLNDAECVVFLRWALPHLGLQWRGYRRVHRQVCKRLDRRIRELNVDGLAGYRAYLGEHADEWTVFDVICSIPISRFYRDRAVFDALGGRILPELAERASVRAPPVVRCWSAGCASGEEPYTVSLLWDHTIQATYRQTRLAIVATDVNAHLLDRARAACYAKSSLRDLPATWIERSFERRGTLYCLRDHWKACIEFSLQDIRLEQPPGEFDLILCRNVAFTYFSEPVQRVVVARLADSLGAAGFLVLGRHEALPPQACLLPIGDAPGIYRKLGERA